MVEDLMTLSFIRKSKLSEISAYFRRCSSYIAAGHKAVCLRGCRICDLQRKYSDMMAFFDKRNSENRPERESMLNLFNIFVGGIVFSIYLFIYLFIFSLFAYFEIHIFEFRFGNSYRTWSGFV